MQFHNHDTLNTQKIDRLKTSRRELSFASHEQECPRELMRKIPGGTIMQALLTSITGKASCNEDPLWTRTTGEYVGTTYFTTGIGLSLSYLSFYTSSVPQQILFLAVGWYLTTSGFRKMQVVIYHHLSHNNAFSSWANLVLGEWIAITLLIRSFVSYQKAHVHEHHETKFHLTEYDETVRFLFKLVGLQPGMSKTKCWIKLWVSIFSPHFHLRFLLQRLRGCFLSSSMPHNILASCYWFLLLMVVATLNAWVPFLVCVLVPLVVFYQISATLRNSMEHVWPDAEVAIKRDRFFICRATFNVYCGEAPPSCDVSTPHGILLWLKWWTLMLFFYYLVERQLVLVGDTPNHALHHRRPKADWVNSAFVCRDDILRKTPGFPETYTEIWGLFQAIDLTFESLSKQPTINPTDLSLFRKIPVY